MVGQLTDQSIDRKLICKCSNLNLLFFVYIIVNVVFWGFGSDKTRHLKMWKHLLSPLNPVKWYFSSCVLKIWCIPIRSMILFPTMFQNWLITRGHLLLSWSHKIPNFSPKTKAWGHQLSFCTRKKPNLFPVPTMMPSDFLFPSTNSRKPQNIQDLIIWNRVRRANLSVWNS